MNTKYLIVQHDTEESEKYCTTCDAYLVDFQVPIVKVMLSSHPSSRDFSSIISGRQNYGLTGARLQIQPPSPLSTPGQPTGSLRVIGS